MVGPSLESAEDGKVKNLAAAAPISVVEGKQGG